MEKLECASRNTFKWFFSNAKKANPDKRYFLWSLDMNTKVKYLLAVLTFKIRIQKNFLASQLIVSYLCKNASAKISAMARVFTFTFLNQRKLIMKTNLMSKFGHCLLLKICHNKTLNSPINSLHERALHLVFKDFKSSFYQLLEKGKVHNSIAPKIMKDIFEIKNH